MSLGLSVWFGIQGLLPHASIEPSDKAVKTEAIGAEFIPQAEVEQAEGPLQGAATGGSPGWMMHLRSLRSVAPVPVNPVTTSPMMAWVPIALGKNLLLTDRTFSGGEVPVAVRQNEQETGRVLVDLSDRKVYLYLNGDLDAEYEVAIGQEEWETPVGQYRVGEMQRDPAWEHPLTGRVVPPGPENPLGAAWISFLTDGDYSFGLHGTLNESLMGEAVSHGCVRMRNDDILALYERIQPGWSLEVVR